MSHNFLTPRPNPKLLSIVMPFYNEEEIFQVLRPRLTKFLNDTPYACEVIAVNDGSFDQHDRIPARVVDPGCGRVLVTEISRQV